MGNILDDIKKMLGCCPDYEAFDTDILININAAIQDLIEAGIGPYDGFIVEGSEEWEDFIGDRKDLESAKQYIYIKCKLVFDPPQSASVITSFEKRAEEIIWRLNHKVEVTP